jgi:A/G-specific adenine glycosylase
MQVSQKILRWYDRHKHDRALPWRDVKDPYKIWLSEVMLQQTTVATVKPYYTRFLARWPTVEKLAAATLEEIRHEWAGLGYYSRAQNLHLAAQKVAALGAFPTTESSLRQLPGIGPYTAAAIAALAFGEKTNVVDGNIERVMARLHASNANLRELAEHLVPNKRAGDYAQGLMDLGALICTPRTPKCPNCPLKRDCLGQATPELYPTKKKKPRQALYATAFIITNNSGEIWLRQRPEDAGILAGLWEVPTSPLFSTPIIGVAPYKGKEEKIGLPPIRHTLTHRDIVIEVVRLTNSRPNDGRWHNPESLLGLPTLTKKILRAYKKM